VAEEGIRARRIAGVVAAGLDVPERSIKQEEAAAMFVWFALFAGMDLPASSALTRQRLGWQPMARRCCRICRRWTTARGADYGCALRRSLASASVWLTASCSCGMWKGLATKRAFWWRAGTT